MVNRAWLLSVILAAACVEGPAAVAILPTIGDIGTGTWQYVSAGQDHTCAVDAGGRAYCWGSNQYGQLGVATVDSTCGPASARYPCSPVPVPVATTVLFVSVSAGGIHTCGITTQQIAVCWGGNASFQLGDNAGGGPAVFAPDGNARYSAISAGETHSCGLRASGFVLCWGSNEQGEVGAGGPGPFPFPTPTDGDQKFTSISAGQHRTCGVLVGGVTECWGGIWLYTDSNGVEYTSANYSPVVVGQAPILGAVAVGGFTTCGLTVSRSTYCWEGNPRGAMGNGTTVGSTVPTAVPSSPQFVQLSGGLLQTCAVSSAGVGYCWGDNSFGELGTPPGSAVERCGGQQPCETRPTTVFGAQTFTMISTGLGSHSCGVTTQHNIYCWGLGVSGQRGDGTLIPAVSIPIKVVSPGQ